MSVMVVFWVLVSILAAYAVARYAPGVAKGILAFNHAIFAVFGILVALYLLSSGATIAIFFGIILFAIGFWKLMFGGFIPGV